MEKGDVKMEKGDVKMEKGDNKPECFQPCCCGVEREHCKMMLPAYENSKCLECPYCPY